MAELDQEKPCRAEFSCEAPNASSVFLVGAFNESGEDYSRMARGAGGDWSVVLQLPSGEYQYKFVAVYHGRMNVRDDGPYGTVNHIVAPLCAVAGSAT